MAFVPERGDAIWITLNPQPGTGRRAAGRPLSSHPLPTTAKSGWQYFAPSRTRSKVTRSRFAFKTA